METNLRSIGQQPRNNEVMINCPGSQLTAPDDKPCPGPISKQRAVPNSRNKYLSRARCPSVLHGEGITLKKKANVSAFAHKILKIKNLVLQILQP